MCGEHAGCLPAFRQAAGCLTPAEETPAEENPQVRFKTLSLNMAQIKAMIWPCLSCLCLDCLVCVLTVLFAALTVLFVPNSLAAFSPPETPAEENPPGRSAPLPIEGPPRCRSKQAAEAFSAYFRPLPSP